MHPRRKPRTRRLIIAILFVALGAFVAHAVALPLIVRSKIESALATLGIADATFDLQRVSLSGIQVRNLHGGRPEWIGAGAIDIQYRLSTIWTGRLDAIIVRDAAWRIGLKDGRISFGPPPRDGELQLTDLPFDRLELRDSRLRLDWEGQEIELSVYGDLARLSPGVFDINLQTEVPHELDLPTPHAAIAGLSAELQGKMDLRAGTISMAAFRGSRGAALVDRVTWRGQTLDGPRAEFSIDDNRAVASATWRLVPEVVATANAGLSMRDGSLHGEVDARIPPFDIASASHLIAAVPQLAAVQVGGTWSAEANVRFDAGLWQPLIKIAAQAGAASSPQWAGAIESADAEITIDGLSPLSTPGTGAQRIAIARARIGELEITDGLIDFALEPSGVLRVDLASWSLGDKGTFRAQPFRFDLAAQAFDVRVDCTDVQLRPWFALLAEDRVRAEGTLQGWLGLESRPRARQKVRLREGQLTARPPIGWIETADAEAISKLLSRADAALAGSGDPRVGQVKDRIVAALQNYQFSMLEFRLIPQDDGVLCRIETSGKGRAGDDPQEIGSLVINVGGFDEIIRAAIAGKSIWDLIGTKDER